MKLLWIYLDVLTIVCAMAPETVSNLTLPAAFKIGIATSAYQIEGGWNESGKGVSIWDTYVHYTPWIIDSSTGDVTADSYHRYKQDVEALAQLGVNFYQFSISWSRILPTGLVNVKNPAGIDYYNQLIDELLKKNIEPMVTIYHWDLPQTLQDLGGWVNPVMVDYFEEYARVLFSAFGDRVKRWITISDPHSISYGYSDPQSFAPGVNGTAVGYYLAAHTLIQAHARVYRIYDGEFRSTQQGQVGIALNGEWYEPRTDSAEDKEAAEMGMQFVLGLFANPVYSSQGDYPDIVRKQVDKLSKAEGYYRSRLRQFTPEEIQSIQGAYDFFGLNYYTSRTAKAPKPTSDLKTDPDINVVFGNFSKATTSAARYDDVVPWGLRKLLNWIKKAYNDVPVIITANGFPDNGGINDTERTRYLISHMSEVLKAVNEDGCNVTAYTFWSLLDGFEWDLGYTLKFGLYYVNYSSPNATRVPKNSANVFSEIIKARKLPAEYLQITGEISGNLTDRSTSKNSSTKLPSSAVRCKGMFFNYSGILFYIWLVTVTYSANIFVL